MQMSLSKPRLIASGLAVAGFGAVALGYAAPHFARTWLPNADGNAAAQTAGTDTSRTLAADGRSAGAKVGSPHTRVATGETVRVDAPHAAVDVNKDSGKVAVRAPYTNVNVDPDKGRVRVRAPYVDLDIRW